MGFVIAVDGPAASGKGTIAARLAGHYGLPFLDTGLLYRAVGVRAAAKTGEFDVDAAERAAAELDLARLDAPELRTRRAGEWASVAASLAGVRARLFALQTAFAAREPGAVLDGRDIGTVIAPHAPAKLFVTAAPEARARRRHAQLIGQGERADLSEVLADILRRDARDRERAAAPLTAAADAVLLDTTDLDISQAVDAARRIVNAARARWVSAHG